MTRRLMCAALALNGCLILAPWQQTAAQPGPAAAGHARICSTRGRAATAANVVDTWSITVSNEGLPCTHERLVGRGDPFQVTQPPQHGQIAQHNAGGRTAVSYTPVPGYVGSDSFHLRSPDRNVDMPYLVTVIP
jgi:hypothetical protein